MAVKTTMLAEVRTCDMCAVSGYAPVRLAVWDAPIPGHGWGYLCSDHASAYGIRAATTIGTRLDYPADVKAAFRREYRRGMVKR